MEESPLGNQSEFYQESSTYQPPPEVVAAKKTPLRSTSTMKWVVLAGGVMVILLLMALLFIPRAEDQAAPAITPTQAPRLTAGPTELELQLKRVDEAVTQADPQAPVVEPPPVDMDVSF
jgi:hypothetical protein